MQFRLATHEEVDSKSFGLEQWTDNNDGDRQAGTEVEWRIRPGELQSIRQLQQLKALQQTELVHPANQGQVKSISPTKSPDQLSTWRQSLSTT